MNRKYCLQILAVVAAANFAGSLPLPAWAQKSATATSVKIGYFNLALIKSIYPGSAESELLRNQAEEQLRKDVDAANKALNKMQSDKRPADELQKALHDSQLAINAETTALAKLVQSQSFAAREKIQQAVAQVARDKNLDLVIDAESVYAGGKTVLDNGVDITADVSKILSPATKLNTEVENK